MDKPLKTSRQLGTIAARTLADAFSRQGFASTELVTRWADIVGAEIAVHAQPERIKWPRRDDVAPEPATLVVRVSGPMALEIQHSSAAILERVNRFFGWQAVGKLALRQAPLRGPRRRTPPPPPDPARVSALASRLQTIENEELRHAVARLGVAIKRT